MLTRLLIDVGSRIARTIGQGKKLLQALWVSPELRQDAYTGLLVFAVAVGSWSLGLLETQHHKDVPVEVRDVVADAQGRFTCQSVQNVLSQKPQAGESLQNQKGTIVASKNGTKYHYLTCPGAGSIKEENKIWFSSEEEAKSAGYSKAANCK